MTTAIYRQDVIMNGDGGEVFQIPPGLSYMSVINNTDNVIYVYQDRRSDNVPQFALIKVPAYTQQTIPISPVKYDFTIFYVNGGDPAAKKAEFLFSVENLQIQGTLGTAISGQVTVVAQSAGLLQTSDLNIDAEKDLQVDVKTLPGVTIAAQPDVNVATMPPVAIASQPDVNVATMPPVSVSTLPDVNVATMPAVTIAAQPDADLAPKTAVKVTAAALGDIVVKAAAGAIYGIRVVGAITVILKDGAVERWAGDLNGFHPIACTTDITLSFSAAGDAYIIYE